MRHLNHTSRPRSGFTLIELLVVLAIIATLAALSTAAYQRVRLTQMVRTSEGTVAKIQTGLDIQVKGIADNVRQEQLREPAPAPGSTTDFGRLYTYCGGDGDLAVAVLLHCRLRQYLPQTSAELSAPSFTFGTVTFQRPAAFNSVASASGTAEEVAGAALYAILTGQSQGGNTFAADEVLSGATVDIPGAGRVFKDGWGKPIAFARFAQSAELDAPPYADGKAWKDPFDPRAKIFGWAGKAALQGAVNLPAVGRNTNVVAYSAGIDKLYGTADDILGYRLRSIGAKGAKP